MLAQAFHGCRVLVRPHDVRCIKTRGSESLPSARRVFSYSRPGLRGGAPCQTARNARCRREHAQRHRHRHRPRTLPSPCFVPIRARQAPFRGGERVGTWLRAACLPTCTCPCTVVSVRAGCLLPRRDSPPVLSGTFARPLACSYRAAGPAAIVSAARLLLLHHSPVVPLLIMQSRPAPDPGSLHRTTGTTED